MTFLEAVVEISKRPEYELCSCPEELNGLYPHLCIYKNGEFVGKLRWATYERKRNTTPAEVDESLILSLMEKRNG